ncbi:MAG TPA: alanyl-tRNA editing protein [Usitatibacter sp.]|jgi:misacylated tRNA(Ala) deacylase|nr:alanyl-tRNA editing protein [Usitatibacter sp.]
MTQEIFRDEPYRKDAEATIVARDARGLVLDRTVFYPRGGGQAGDSGVLHLAGAAIAIADTVKGEVPGEIIHVPAPGQEALLDAAVPGAPASLTLDWERRHRHMRFHTATHLLCAIVPHETNGCSITSGYARLDFDMVEPLDREHLERELSRLVDEAHDTSTVWITDGELDAKPELVRTMSVKPPRGVGRIRLLEIAGVDLQACGGTHVANTREIGKLRIAKIEKKSARSRRVMIEFVE